MQLFQIVWITKLSIFTQRILFAGADLRRKRLLVKLPVAFLVYDTIEIQRNHTPLELTDEHFQALRTCLNDQEFAMGCDLYKST